MSDKTKNWQEPKSGEEKFNRTRAIAKKLDEFSEDEYESFKEQCEGVSPQTIDRIRRRETLQAHKKGMEILEKNLELYPNREYEEAFEPIEDGLPKTDGSICHYEKDLLNDYADGILSVFPSQVSTIEEKENREAIFHKNPLPEERIGKYRRQDAQVIVDVRYNQLDKPSSSPTPTLLEAGPRELLLLPDSEQLNVGILVSGGIAPGINAVINAIVNRHELYQEMSTAKYSLHIYGYRDGFRGLYQGGSHMIQLDSGTVRNQAYTGGSLVGTSRFQELSSENDLLERQRLIINLVHEIEKAQIRILYIVGGDGSMRAAHVISQYATHMFKQNRIRYIPVIVGIPKTMDNDILFAWQSLGFQSAWAKATEFVLQLYREVVSNPRLCIAQLYGSDSGFIVGHAALASGVCDEAIIPEKPFTLKELSKRMQELLYKRRIIAPNTIMSPYGLIVMGETAIPEDYEDYTKRAGLDEEECAAIRRYKEKRADQHVYGDVDDELRSASLKLVSRTLQHDIRRNLSEQSKSYWDTFRVSHIEPKWLLRSCPPSAAEVLYGQRLGMLAVDNALAGYTDFMISQWLTEYVLVPLELVTKGQKRVPLDGIFWRSAEASTENRRRVYAQKGVMMFHP